MASQNLASPARQLRLRVEAKKPTIHQKVADKNRKGSSSKANLELLYTDSSYKPSRHVNNLSVSKVPGRYGLVVNEPMDPADTLMVSEPLAYLTAEQGTELRPKDLLEVLKAMELTAADSYRLGLLNNGTKGCSKALTSIEQLLNAEEQVKKEAARRDAARRGFGAASSSAREEAPAASRSPAQLQLQTLVKLNSYGNAHADFAASSCRGEAPTAFIGLWPEFACLNHSCAPNAVGVLVGDRMVVRATRSIPKHGEVTVSYLHDHVFAPLAERRRFIQGAYGFKCQCYRCTLEEAQPAEVQVQLQSAWDRMSDAAWMGRARAILNSKSPADVEALTAEVQQCTQGIEAAFKEAGVAEDLQPWLKASAFGAYEMLAICRDVGHESDPQHPASLTGLVSLIVPGSEGHLFLTLERLERALQIAPESPEAKSAMNECIVAHQLRYGLMTNAVLSRIIDARTSVDHYMGRCNLGGAKPEGLVVRGLSASSLTASSPQPIS